MVHSIIWFDIAFKWILCKTEEDPQDPGISQPENLHTSFIWLPLSYPEPYMYITTSPMHRCKYSMCSHSSNKNKTEI